MTRHTPWKIAEMLDIICRLAYIAEVLTYAQCIQWCNFHAFPSLDLTGWQKCQECYYIKGSFLALLKC